MRTTMTCAGVAGLGFLAAASAWAGECGDSVLPGSVAETTGFQRAESVFWDEGSEAFYISNMGPAGPAPADQADGDGSLSKLVPGQAPVPWVTGLNSPKGIRCHGGRLYVADLDRIVVVRIETGAIERKIEVPVKLLPGETLKGVLNDPVVHGRDLYVSDFRSYTVWHVNLVGEPDPEELLGPLELKAYGQPNGLFLKGRTIWVGTGGVGSATAPGYLLEVDLRTRSITSHGQQFGRIDGLEGDGRTLLLTDNEGGVKPSRLLRYDPRRRVVSEILLSDTRAKRADGSSFYTRFADLAFREEDCTVVIPCLESPSGASLASPHFIQTLRLAEEPGCHDGRGDRDGHDGHGGRDGHDGHDGHDD